MMESNLSASQVNVVVSLPSLKVSLTQLQYGDKSHQGFKVSTSVPIDKPALNYCFTCLWPNHFSINFDPIMKVEAACFFKSESAQGQNYVKIQKTTFLVTVLFNPSC